ncbi:MAG: hypothetical protein JNJ60_11150 [Rhodocyclaceae bacterium]|nr:hypothetical protein [Rhodocyclaceae bacterium]
MNKRSQRGPRQARGGALLMAFGLVFMLGLVLFVSNLPRRSPDIAVSAKLLATAREALIARAAAEDNSPGSLPCPDTDGDGDADYDPGGANPCRGALGSAAFVGHLPWKTLGIAPPRDPSGNCIWYILAAPFRNTIRTSWRGTPAYPAINPDTPAPLRLHLAAGVEVAAAALLIAPGPPLPGQARSGNGCDGVDAAAWLDSDGASGASNASGAPDGLTFWQSGVQPGMNDEVLAITPDDLFRLVNRRVLAEVAGNAEGSHGLAGYYRSHGYYPYAAATPSGNASPAQLGPAALPYNLLSWRAPGPAEAVAPALWLTRNGWLERMRYQVASGYVPGSRYPQDCSSCIALAAGGAAQAVLELPLRTGSTAQPLCVANPLLAGCARP